MNGDFPPLRFSEPEILDRRAGKPRPAPSSPEAIAQRVQKAAGLQRQLRPIARRLRTLTPQQRRAFFVKIRHSAPISLSGTGLKPISIPSADFTLAVPRGENLDPLSQKISAFGHDEIRAKRIPNEALVARLETIQQGTPQDRLSDEMRELYPVYVKSDWVVVEVDITSLATGRLQQKNEVSDTIASLNVFLGPGVRGQIYEHEYSEGVLRAVIGCTGDAFRALVEDAEWQTKLTWFEPQPKFDTFFTTLREFAVENLDDLGTPAADAPMVCVIDSGLSMGNPFLNGITREDLLYSFLKDRPDDVHDDHGHGSGVASLASYYLLNLAQGAANQGRFWVSSARILDENNECPERLLSAVIREVVATLKPLGVKIFNLSVNVFARPWNIANRRLFPKRSWVARTIDELTRQEDVVFVISAGNLHTDTVAALNDVAPYPKYLADDQCRILDPAQSALALSVGSIAATTQLVGPVNGLMALADRNQPSPFTRTGPGIRGEIKPELVEYGGNVAYDGNGGVRKNAGCSVIVASNTLAPPVAYDIGTSIAAPKVTHQLAAVKSDLDAVAIEPGAALLKALIVNSATYHEDVDEVRRFIDDIEPTGFDWQNILGYGLASADRATYCDDFSTVLLYQGTLAHNKVAFFEIPVPVALTDAPRQNKTLRITVVYHPDVHIRGFNDYFGTTLNWRLFRGNVPKHDVMAIMSAGVDIEDARELRGVYGIQKRSKGSVQQDVFVWRDHRAEYSAHNYTLAVTTFERWGRNNPAPISYAVVARLEDESRSIEIYNDVAAAVEVPAEIRARVGP